MEEYGELNNIPMWVLESGVATVYPEFMDNMKAGPPAKTPDEAAIAAPATVGLSRPKAAAGTPIKL